MEAAGKQRPPLKFTCEDKHDFKTILPGRMPKTLGLFAYLFVGAVLIFAFAALVSPKFYGRIRQHLRPDELHFTNERVDRERQIAMLIIGVIALSVLLGQVHC